MPHDDCLFLRLGDYFHDRRAARDGAPDRLGDGPAEAPVGAADGAGGSPAVPAQADRAG